MKSGRVRMKESKHPRYKWEVNWWQGGKFVRKLVATKGAAKNLVEVTEKALEGTVAEDAPLSPGEWLAVREARREGVELLGAVRGWLEAAGRRAGSVTVAELVRQRLAALPSDGLSRSYARTIVVAGKALAEGFGELAVRDFGGQEAAQAMYLGGGNAVTVGNRRRLLFGIFEWGRGRGLVEGNPVGGVKPPRKERSSETTVSVLSPGDARRLLLSVAGVSPAMLPAVAIRLFAGLRSEEVKRLKWDDVALTRGFIEVRAAISKTRSRRLVSLEPVLAEILAQCGREAGRVWPVNGQRLLDAAQKAAGWAGARHWSPAALAGAPPWPKNALRDSFASYHLAMWQSASATAAECGHSETVLFKHYREVVTAEAATEFWSSSLVL